MHDFFSNILIALGQSSATQGAAGATGSTGSVWDTIVSFLPFVAIIGVFYFLIIRPQNKKQKDAKLMIASMQKGDHVITIGGAHGTIQAVKDKTVVIKMDDECRIEFEKSAIATVRREGADKPAELPSSDQASK